MPFLFSKNRARSTSAVVTGAGSGIGRAFALAIARRGGQVVCADINLAAAEETAALVEARGGKSFALACDVSKLKEVEKLANQSERLLRNPVDLVVNNAGVGAGGQVIGESQMGDWHWVLSINLWGVIHGCHVFAPRLRALRRGGIINVASAAGFAAGPTMAAYNVSKAGVMSLSETLAAELAGTRVVVTVLCPTFVKTNIIQAGRIPTMTSSLAAELMQRVGSSPDKVALMTLQAHERGELYVLPQLDARAVWRMKRFAPVTYSRVAGFLGRWAPLSMKPASIAKKEGAVAAAAAKTVP